MEWRYSGAQVGKSGIWWNKVFRGVTNLSLDSKGRLTMPTRHRAGFAADQDALVMTIDAQATCLSLYPLSTWLAIERQIDALPSLDPEAVRIKRMLIGHATDLALDTAGRILVPPELRQYAGLEKDAVLLGQGKKLELWSQANWAEQTLAFSQSAKSGVLPAALAEIAL
ncbi:division/cell wall cluster transcriptional repressor MraZ [Halothiobacillus sp. DCM-1]|uniref:division/cell wall cluster transcriptional repressor MraZ n=1 Tax=Halothiobacillus sp. DCM-1 TaxID=3112558 RepID=UPI0032484E8C